jgi:hypothetical protein
MKKLLAVLAVVFACGGPRAHAISRGEAFHISPIGNVTVIEQSEGHRGGVAERAPHAQKDAERRGRIDKALAELDPKDPKAKAEADYVRERIPDFAGVYAVPPPAMARHRRIARTSIGSKAR